MTETRTMPTTSRRAVLTGLGVLSPIGTDPAAFWQALLAGTPGLHAVRSFDASALPCRVAGEILDFDARKFLPPKPPEPRKALKVMARTVQMGVCAAQKAMEDAGLTRGQIPPARFGVEFGCVMVATELEDMARGAKVSTGDLPPGEVDMAAWGRDGLRLVTPLWMLKYLPNMPACHVSISHDAQGPNNTITAADAASLLALGEAYRVFGRGHADAFLVGGCDSKINPLSFTRHNIFQPFTRRNDAPEKAVRPFDAGRDGTAFSEGAAVFVMEELSGGGGPRGEDSRRGVRVRVGVRPRSQGADPGPSHSECVEGGRGVAGGRGPRQRRGRRQQGVGRLRGAGAGRGARPRGAGVRPAGPLRNDGGGIRPDRDGRERAGPGARAVAGDDQPRDAGPGVSGERPRRRAASGDEAVCGEGVVHGHGPVRGGRAEAVGGLIGGAGF
jgi:hypothetical protein